MRTLLWIGLGFSLLIASCGSKNQNSGSAESVTSVPAALPVSSDAGSTAFPEPDQKLIRQAHLRLQADTLKRMRMILNQLLLRHKAFIANENEQHYSGTSENTLVIRIPNDQLNAFIDVLCEKANFVERREITSDDIGMEYIDLQARLKAKQEVEKRYLQLLQRAGKMSELLEVENQLGTVRAEIESLQGRIHYFDNKVAYATLHLSLYELVSAKDSPGPGFGSRAFAAFQNSFKLLQEGILLLISVWPLMLIPGIVLIIIAAGKRKRVVR
ncbi:MAG: DUF4349 domain-containing protein [Bacteroidia bacterium]|nr:DUF4349 domain-containing protein [Bacteroidia bacterium]